MFTMQVFPFCETSRYSAQKELSEAAPRKGNNVYIEELKQEHVGHSFDDVKGSKYGGCVASSLK